MAPVAAAPAKGAPPAPIPAAESASLEDKNWFFDKVLFVYLGKLNYTQSIDPNLSTHAFQEYALTYKR